MKYSTTGTIRMPAAERRQQILDTSLSVFAQSGYHETSMNALAAEAGVTKPVLYQHFESKHDLFVQLLQRTGDSLHSSITAETAKAITPRQRVEAGFRAFFRFFDQFPDAFAVLYSSNLGSVSEFRKEARRIQETFVNLIARMIRSTNREDALALAAGINGVAEGMVRYWMHEGHRHTADSMASLTAKLAWSGLARLA